MVHVLFVCLGNICRSPMAEAMFRDLVKREGLDRKISIDSAGTGDWHVGHPPHLGTRQLLDQRGISYEGMQARQLSVDDFENFDYIIGMDASNINNIQSIEPKQSKARVIRLLDLASDQLVKDVPDPYYTGNFDEVAELVASGCQALLELIKMEHSL
ncbi:low molecular weight protein-tyrosine-phosphatase [Bacillus testis]|uniref:low molecular weight protein-tyrosine-phosphatase n=1 Tax=Bacillus testis TaxID=1622072 RepID=UPI00067EEEF0|nr:low molecular weight protein-tyrosine-phosphatase [Bacillus testis]